MIILRGVRQSGEAQAVGTPSNPRRTLRFARLQTETIRVCVTDEAGVAVDLTLFTATLTVRVRSDCDERALRKQVTGNAYGYADFAFAATDTRNMEPGRYVFDVWISKTGEQQAVIGLSPFILEPSAF